MAAEPIPTSTNELARDAGAVSGPTLASRVLGLLRDSVLASVLGAGTIMDVYATAFMIPNLFRRLVGEGALSVAFVPIFTGWLQRSREEARTVFNATWTLTAIAGVVITLVGIATAGPFIDLFAPGFALTPGKRELATEMLRICFPYIFFMSLLAVAMGALNSLRHFFMPAFAPIVLNVLQIAAALVGAYFVEGPPLHIVCWSVIAAGALQLAIQIPVLRRVGMAPRPVFAFNHPAVRRLLVLMGPSVLGASVYQFNLFIVRALASFQGEGAIAYLYYADRLLEFPLGVFVFAIGSASLTALSRCVKAGDAEGVRRSFAGALALAAALAVPSTVGLVVLREGLMGALFNWNSAVFGDEAVRGCARALLFYALGLVPITAARIYAQLLISHENTSTPAWAAVVSVIVNGTSALMLIGPLPAGSLPSALLPLQHSIAFADLGYAGLALATTIAALANVLFLAIWTARHHATPLFTRGDLVRHAKIALASLVMGVVLVGLETWAPLPLVASPRALALLLLHVGIGGVLYLAVLRALRSPEFGSLAALAQLRR